MNDIRVIKLEDENSIYINTIAKWMYDWWGSRDGYSLEAMNCFIKHSLCKDKLPHTYIALVDEQLVGMFQFSYADLVCRPDIYPWLCNVYVEQKYRQQGIFKVMMNQVFDCAQEAALKELFLYTKHIGLYEKYGWEFVGDIETFTNDQHVQRLYKLDINKQFRIS